MTEVDTRTGEIVTVEPRGIEVYALDLDWDLIQHLASPETVRFLQAEQIGVELIEDDLAHEVFVWQMAHLREHGQPASATVLEAQFDDINFEHPQTSVGDLIDRLRRRFMQNHGRDAVRMLSRLANTDPLTVGSEMMKVGRGLSALTNRRGETYGTHDWRRALSHYDQLVLRGRGPTLGYAELDDHFNGIMGVTFLIAPPKRYKSWAAINSTMSQILVDGYPNYYTLELPAVDVEWRLSCMLSGIPYWKYLKGAVTPRERAIMTENMEELAGRGKWDIEKPLPGNRSATQLIERSLNRGASCVIIDQLQYVENSRGVTLGASNNTGDYWEVCNALRDYSDEIPIFVVHQFNRSVMNAQVMPEMQQAKGSSAIEEVGTLILGMWSSPSMRSNNILEVGTLASRHFSYGAWELNVDLSDGCRLGMIGEVIEQDTQ